MFIASTAAVAALPPEGALAGLARDLYATLSQEPARLFCDGRYAALFSQVNDRFAEEAEIMRETGFPGADHHIDEHHRILEAGLDAAWHALNGGDPSRYRRALFTFLFGLVRHRMEEDRVLDGHIARWDGSARAA